MQKPKKIANAEESAKYLKQLEDENLKLRIENAYLKELRKLRLEEEAQSKKQPICIAKAERFYNKYWGIKNQALAFEKEPYFPCPEKGWPLLWKLVYFH